MLARRLSSKSLQAKCLIVAATPVDWIPLTVAADMFPARTGSSLNDSNPLPPSGDRCMLVVGPRSTDAPFAMASLPCRAPPFWMRFTSHVAARPVPVDYQRLVVADSQNTYRKADMLLVHRRRTWYHGHRLVHLMYGWLECLDEVLMQCARSPHQR